MASLRDLDRYLLDGIVLPPKFGVGRWPAELRAQWHDAVEILLGRGVESPRRMAKITGLTDPTCKRLIEDVKERWAKGVTASDLNWRREALYREAEEVSRSAWDAITTARSEGNLREQGAMLKVVLASNARKAKLIGADTMAVQIRQEITATIGIDIVAQVEADYGLAAGALERLGKQASVMFSEASKLAIEAQEEDTIDVDFEVSGAQPTEPQSALARLLARAADDDD